MQEFVDDLRGTLPLSTEDVARQLSSELGLSSYDASIIASDPISLRFFRDAARGRNGQKVANWLTTDLFGRLGQMDVELSACGMRAEQLGSIVDAVEGGNITCM